MSTFEPAHSVPRGLGRRRPRLRSRRTRRSRCRRFVGLVGWACVGSIHPHAARGTLNGKDLQCEAAGQRPCPTSCAGLETRRDPLSMGTGFQQPKRWRSWAVGDCQNASTAAVRSGGATPTVDWCALAAGFLNQPRLRRAPRGPKARYRRVWMEATTGACLRSAAGALLTVMAGLVERRSGCGGPPAPLR
jgi:hypothetical protein